jgi:peroxiredoxin
MLAAGGRYGSDVQVWDAAGEQMTLARALAGDGLVLLCFYPFDWSPG